jgi:hypothetical protein
MTSTGGGDQFASMAGAVAQELLGEPNRKLSSNAELRFGNKGSISVDLVKGTWFEHGTDVGGGVLALIERETGRKGRDAVEWLRDHGFHVEDDGRSQRPAQRDSNRNYRPDNDGSDRQDNGDGPPFRETKTWDYHDEAGKLLFQVVRMENGLIGKDGKPEKTYRQRQPDQSKPGGWNWSTKGVRQVPYRLADLIEAVGQDLVVFVVEGEKAADRLLDEGVPATTNARGAGKWVEELNAFFKGARVVVLADDDPQAKNAKTNELKFHDDGRPVFVGIDHANDVARNIDGIAKDVRVVQLTDVKKKEDVVDWLDQGGTVEKLYEIAAKAPRYEKEPYRSKFRAVTWSNLDAPGPEHEWLIKGILTRGEMGMTAGPSQSGKSFLVLDMALAIARGNDWFGRRVRHGGVVYQAGEGQKGLKKRIRAYRNFNSLTTEDDLPFVLLPSRIDLYSNNDLTEEFIAEVNHWASTFPVPLELVVIDTWATATTGANENDGKDVSVILERCARISQATKAAVLLVHHMNAEGAKVRGHTSILANLENVLLVRQVDGLHDGDNRQIREAVVSKNKDGEGGQSFRFVLKSVKIGVDEDLEPVTSCVVARTNGDGSDAPVPERAQISDADAMLIRAIEKAVTDGGTKPPAGTGLPQHLRVVEWKQVMKAYDSIAFDADETENETPEAREKRLAARRQALKRSGERLVRKGLIARENPWVWLTGKAIKGYRRQTDNPPPDDPPEDNRPASAALNDGLPEMWGDDE